MLRIKQFSIRYHHSSYASCCFDEFMDLCLYPKPSETFAKASTDSNVEHPMGAYSLVMYERLPRDHNKPGLSRSVNDFQAAMETCLSELSQAERHHEQNQKGLKSIFRKPREASETATALINQKIEEFNRLKKLYLGM